MGDAEEIRSAATVRHWFASARHDAAPPADQERYLSLLAGFVSHAGKSPDELVEYCFLRKKDSGERFSSVKRRGEVNDWIEAWVAEQAWTGKDAVTNGNVVRGFMIHNGAVIQGGVWRG